MKNVRIALIFSCVLALLSGCTPTANNSVVNSRKHDRAERKYRHEYGFPAKI